MLIKYRIYAFPVIITLLAGCASQPSVSQLKQEVHKVLLVENGSAPLSYSTGVVDAASFWGQYGSSVGGQLGVAGMAAGSGLAQAGDDITAQKFDKNREMVKRLYGSSQMAQTLNSTLLPKLASAWGISYDQQNVRKLHDDPVVISADNLHVDNFQSDADLILMTEVNNINLTERFSTGGALASGFTFGTNKKSLTTEVMVIMRALKRDSAGGGYKQVWSTACGPNYTSMKTSFYLEDIVKDSAKMTEILDEATTRAEEYCDRSLARIAVAK